MDGLFTDSETFDIAARWITPLKHIFQKVFVDHFHYTILLLLRVPILLTIYF